MKEKDKRIAPKVEGFSSYHLLGLCLNFMKRNSYSLAYANGLIRLADYFFGNSR